MPADGVFASVNSPQTGDDWLGDGSEIVNPTNFFNPIRKNFLFLATGVCRESVSMGGSNVDGILSATPQPLVNAIVLRIDNTGTYVSTTAGLTAVITVWVRTEDAGVSVTPRIYNLTTSAVATSSGAVASTGTMDDFTGLDQKQTLTLTIATGINDYIVQLVPQSANAVVYGLAWARVTI